MRTRLSSTRRWQLFAVAFLLGAGAGLYFYVLRPGADVEPVHGPIGPPSLTLEEGQRLLKLGRAGVAEMENDRLAEAERIFVELAGQLPQEVLPPRNTLICRLLMLQRKDRALQSVGVEGQITSLEQAVADVVRLEPQNAGTFWLAGTASMGLAESATDDAARSRHTADALRQLDSAMRLAPTDPVYAVQYYLAGRNDTDTAVVDLARAALRKAYELDSHNLFILTEWLQVQSEARDPAIRETLVEARQVLAPLAAAIQRRTRVDVLALLDQGGQAAAESQWNQVRRSVLPLMGLVRSEEVAQSDLRRAEVNPLEFVAYDFSPAYLEKYALAPQPAAPVALAFRATRPLDDLAPAEIRDALLADVDLDERPDLLVLKPGRLEAYRLDPLAKRGSLIAAVDVPPHLRRVLFADLDQDSSARSRPAAAPPTEAVAAQDPGEHCFDADGDCVLYGPEGVLMLRNQLDSDGGARSWQVVAQDPAFAAGSAVRAATLVDLDHDGDLDIVAATETGIRLWSNRGQLLFADTSEFSTLPAADAHFDSLSVVDWDRDVDLDIVLAGGTVPAGHLENLRHGQFRWQPFAAGFQGAARGSGAANHASAVIAGELDGHPSWDLALAGEAGLEVRLTRTLPAKSVSFLARQAVSTIPCTGVVSADFDRDAWTDLLTWHRESLRIFRRDAAGAYQEAEIAWGAFRGTVQSCAVSDADADGDVDILMLADGGLTLWLNETFTTHQALTMHCKGGEDNRSGRVNAWGLGSLIELKAGGMYQAQVVTSQTTHFGLGSAAQADVARILWTQGIPQTIIAPRGGSTVCEPMMLKGSCPYAYAWNGEFFEFFTDLLWAAPIGLQLADGVLARDRPWEYLKLPGDRLRARDGEYHLRITEELWEAAYFDQVELLAVDHPADVEVFSNEKVGPPEIAEFKLHSVRQRRPLAAAHNQRGRDLLPQLARADGDMAQAFDQTLRQGLAEEHHLELDLGPLDAPRHITLFLTGWIRPTDTSLNVALSHHPELKTPQPPGLWVPGEDGQWHEAVAFMGFPGGKTKTIAVDLSGIFRSADYRVRLRTSAELYWDEAFFTVDEAPAELRVTPRPLLAAELHYRGFSEAISLRRSVPDAYDYRRVDTEAHWPPLRGRFTRYGDVRELLLATDAQLVVLGAGDEIALRFAADEPAVPAGWKRDFILHNVGWDKDADLNTVYGQTVEPLPFVGMESYPYLDNGPLATEAHRRYVREYQTRELPVSQFWGWGDKGKEGEGTREGTGGNTDQR